MAGLHSVEKVEAHWPKGFIPTSTLGRCQNPSKMVSMTTTTTAETALKSENMVTDQYGFYVTLEEKSLERSYLRKHPDKPETRRAWQKMMERWNRTPHSTKKKYCRAGIPQSLRRTVWPLLLNSYGWEMTKNRDYSTLRSQSTAGEEVFAVIERDLNRTFPTHKWFADPGGLGQRKLRGILRAYANLDERVTYVQGMGFLAATLLVQIEDEESTFWAFASLMQRPKHGLAESYLPGFPALYMRFYQLQRIMQRTCGGLARQVTDLQVDPSIYATQWYLTLFSYHLNFALLSRIWDMFLCEGWKIIHRVAIAFLTLHQKQLESVNNQCDFLIALRSIHDGKDSDMLLETALKVEFKTSEMEKWEKKFKEKESKKK